jgi:hypothetical protein
VARFGDDDRAALLADFGLTVKYGSETTEGIFDDEERLETDEAGTQIVTTEQVISKRGSLSTVSPSTRRSR